MYFKMNNFWLNNRSLYIVKYGLKTYNTCVRKKGNSIENICQLKDKKEIIVIVFIVTYNLIKKSIKYLQEKFY